MKTKLSALLLFSCIMVIPIRASAMDFGVGLYTYCAWWQPSVRTQYSQMNNDTPIFLFGPILSVSFLDKWNISFVVM